MDRLEVKASLSVDEAGTVTGLAWPFDDGPCGHGDLISKGAFNIAVADVPMLLGHDPEAVIGLWDEVKETPRGLEVKGRLFLEGHRRAKAVRSLMMSGLINGLSIGFRTKASKPRLGKGRTITKLDLHEVSVVRNPAHPRARLSAKSASIANTLAEAITRAASALRT